MMLPSERRVLQVLVVDDSAVVREVMQRILAADDSFAVTTAADPLIAVRKMATSRPDVIVLDLAMPQMDGLSFLRKVMAEDPISRRDLFGDDPRRGRRRVSSARRGSCGHCHQASPWRARFPRGVGGRAR